MMAQPCMASPLPRESSTWYVECVSGISSAGSRVSRRIVFVLDYSSNRIVPAPCIYSRRRCYADDMETPGLGARACGRVVSDRLLARDQRPRCRFADSRLREPGPLEPVLLAPGSLRHAATAPGLAGQGQLREPDAAERHERRPAVGWPRRRPRASRRGPAGGVGRGVSVACTRAHVAADGIRLPQH